MSVGEAGFASSDLGKEETRVALYLGALLHDVGKVVYRGSSERGTHSELGYDFILQDVFAQSSDYESEIGRQILDQIRYHHARELGSASRLEASSLAYITYFADNVSAGMDRKNEGAGDRQGLFDRNAELRKVFNILHGRMDDNVVEHEDYNLIRERIKKGLVGTRPRFSDLNSIVNLLEATTSGITSSTNTAELCDISLYDHAKTTAGIAICLYDYLAEQQVRDYRKVLFLGKEMYSAPAFLLYSCDMSGIQAFIYNISGSGALKQLRARSFYLELLMEHIVDELLGRLSLCRANMLYAGGGHAYLLLPNTAYCKETLRQFDSELQEWLLQNFGTDLYLASAYVECSSDDLMNKGEDGHRYGNLYRSLSLGLSRKKASRYSADVIKRLNFAEGDRSSHERECSECHRSDILIGKDGLCAVCRSLRDISAHLVKKDVFVIRSSDDDMTDGEPTCLPLPFGRSLSVFAREDYLRKKPSAVRVYTKNEWDMGLALSTHIWMSDYEAQADEGQGRFASYGEWGVSLASDKGIRRLGVLRADVDDLGAAFVNGLPADKASLSRTATFSRALSYFFKKEMNHVLECGGYRVQVIYSGGDDMFLIGNWSDVIFAAVDIRNAFIEFTGNGSLSISAGIGIFDEKYPVARMAAETGSLEDAAKLYIDPEGRMKNAVALWSEQSVFSWDEFVDRVVPRMREMQNLFDGNEKGKAFIYKLIALLRSFDDVSSAPRLAYLLARSFEDEQVGGSEHSLQFYEWATDEQERRYLITALEWYVYSIRERG